ncbi:Mu transposase C-terminal domain-containing protein [Sulfurovum sp.]|uniref:Mu transposase C-terminal domain-containing protein n=1 Tax=Sulfurovum sp. TaxID=1969726 RepID=UPI003561BAB6
MVAIVTDGYVEYNASVYRITQVIDFDEVIGIDIETKRAKRLMIKNLKPLKAEAVNDNGFIYRDLTDISDTDWKEIERRFMAIKPLLNGMSRVEIEKHANDMGVHYTTLYRWLKGYKSTGTLTGLLPKKEGRKAGEVRIESRAEAIIQETIQSYYLTRQKHSIQFVINKVFAQCSKENIASPSHNTIRNRISRITEYERLKKQGNASIARDRFNPAPNHFDADYPLQVVQIDHTKADIILVDDETRMPIGRPWITLMIDIYSRMITGYFLSLDEPSSTSVAMCIANAVLPKDGFLLKHEIDVDWNVWGFMQTIHADNGSDFRTDTLEHACKSYGTHIEFRPIDKKDYGGHIERVIGTVMKQVHSLPGTTFSNINERQAYDSDGNATMTFSEFEKWVLTFITKIYHKRKHSSLGMSPEAKWNEGIFGSALQEGIGYPPKPSDPLTILIDFLPHFQRTIQKNGVNIDGLNYYDHILRPFINQIDVKTGKKRRFIFKRDVRDISYIWYYDEATQNYYKINLANSEIPTMSLWEYREIRRRIGERNASSISDHELIAAHEELHQQVLEASKKTKKARRQMQKVKNREQNGTMPSAYRKPRTLQDIGAVEGDDSLWDDNLPTFD